jgi:NAD(P)-dependent dehydrogenase (short-subunit alcohol dehydrogenase family)
MMSDLNNKLAGKVALITGAASGIGQATAELLAEKGASIAIVDIKKNEGTAVVQSINKSGGKSLFMQCDVTNESQCRQTVQKTKDELGGLDILVNNAGIIKRASLIETSEEEWDRTMAVNVKSVFLLSKFAIPLMYEAGGGAIVNIASGWGLVGGERAAAYSASKGAVVNLTKAMALDHGEKNIRVNCICPGDVDTPLLRSEAEQLGVPLDTFLEEASQRPLKRPGKPEEIAQAVLFLASESSSFVTGSILVVDGGGLAG